MGLTYKNKNEYEQADALTMYFSLDPIEEEKQDYDEIKSKINKLNIDIEEKANIINKINSLNFTSSSKEKKEIEKEINKFITDYNI